MARRLCYTGEPVISATEVAEQARVEVVDLQAELVEQIIIPAVIAQAELKTSAAIREAEYEEEWPSGYLSGQALDIGQAQELLSLEVLQADGSAVLIDPLPAHRLERGQRQSYLHFPQGRPVGRLRLRYRAALDLEAYPAVKTWLLMQAAAAYEQRESLVKGSVLHEVPASYLDTLLAEIEVPPRF